MMQIKNRQTGAAGYQMKIIIEDMKLNFFDKILGTIPDEEMKEQLQEATRRMQKRIELDDKNRLELEEWRWNLYKGKIPYEQQLQTKLYHVRRQIEEQEIKKQNIQEVCKTFQQNHER